VIAERAPVAVVGGFALLGLVGILAVLGLSALTLPLIAVAALVVVALLVERPALLLAGFLCLVVLIEGKNEQAFVPALTKVYDPVFAGVTPIQIAVVLIVAAVLLDASRRQDFRLPGGLTIALALLCLGLVIGLITGYYGGGHAGAMLRALFSVACLILVPLVVVNLVRTRAQLHTALVVAALLAGAKSAIGLAAIITGQGFALASAPGATRTLTYYESTANWLTMAFSLCLLSAFVRRVRLPLWVWSIWPFAIASLLFSYRRSFWIAAVIGLCLVALLGVGRLGRLVLLPMAVIAGIGLALVLSGTVVIEAQGPLAKRVQSLNPIELRTNPEDRYRLDERRNVLADIGEHPIAGTGLAVPWDARYPLSVEHPGGRVYVHFAALWFWLNLGIVGLIAYVAYIGTGIAYAYGLWRRASDELLRTLGLGLVGSFAGLVLAEATASFTGVELRFSIVIGATLGLLASARRLVSEGADVAPANEPGGLGSPPA
jgi:O-antigen ligase